MLAAQELKKALGGNKNLKFILGGSAPENFTGEIIKFSPSHIIIIDSADLGKNAGAIELIKEEDIGGVSFSTHRLPTKILIDYLKNSINCEFIFIGIQPKTLKFGDLVSEEVKASVKFLSESIQEILSA